MIKRLFDVCIAASVLVIAAPLMVLIAALIKATSPGPAIYSAVRVGRYGTRFRILKFRTMVVDADQRGPHVTRLRDERITQVGRVVRHWKLDELPQMLNVLRGEMSIVGPRPEDPRFVAHYTRDQLRILSAKPGVTSAASIQYRHEERLLADSDSESRYVDDILPAKIALDMESVDRPGLWRDIGIVLKTVAAIVR